MYINKYSKSLLFVFFYCKFIFKIFLLHHVQGLNRRDIFQGTLNMILTQNYFYHILLPIKKLLGDNKYSEAVVIPKRKTHLTLSSGGKKNFMYKQQYFTSWG